MINAELIEPNFPFLVMSHWLYFFSYFHAYLFIIHSYSAGCEVKKSKWKWPSVIKARWDGYVSFNASRRDVFKITDNENDKAAQHETRLRNHNEPTKTNEGQR